jgi:hypothetical protein
MANAEPQMVLTPRRSRNPREIESFAEEMATWQVFIDE